MLARSNLINELSLRILQNFNNYKLDNPQNLEKKMSTINQISQRYASSGFEILSLAKNEKK